jgi:hypothetical protein
MEGRLRLFSRPPAYPAIPAPNGEARPWWPELALGLLAGIALLRLPAAETVLAFCVTLPAVFWWLGSARQPPEGVAVLVVPFVVMIAAGLVHAFPNGWFDIGKDVWYIGNTGLLLVTGYCLARMSGRFESVARPLLLVGLLAALLHLYRFVLHPEVLLEPASTIRRYAGTGSDATTAVVLLIIAARLMGVRIFGPVNWLTYVIGLVCALSVVLSFSRTTAGVVLVWAVIVLGIVDVSTPRRLAVLGLALVGLVLIAVSIPMPLQSGRIQGTFLDKLTNTLNEVRIEEHAGRTLIEERWRGYESARALRVYREGRPDQWLVGQGLGSKVDLGLALNFGGRIRQSIRYAPVLHNGYLYVLVKTGLIGMVATLVFLVGTAVIGMRAAAATGLQHRILGRWIVASVVAIGLTNWTTSSLFPKFDHTTFFMLGAFVALVAGAGAVRGAAGCARASRTAVPSRAAA